MHASSYLWVDTAARVSPTVILGRELWLMCSVHIVHCVLETVGFRDELKAHPVSTLCSSSWAPWGAARPPSLRSSQVSARAGESGPARRPDPPDPWRTGGWSRNDAAQRGSSCAVGRKERGFLQAGHHRDRGLGRPVHCPEAGLVLERLGASTRSRI